MRSTHQRTLVALAAVAATVLAGEGMRGAPTQEPTAQHPGRADYIEVGCYQCHGYEGQGGSRAGPRIAPRPGSFDRFARVVRRPPLEMPAYSPRVLSDEKLQRIHAYLESIPEPPELSSLPALSGR